MISKIAFFQRTCLFFHVSLDPDLVWMDRHKNPSFQANSHYNEQDSLTEIHRYWFVESCGNQNSKSTFCGWKRHFWIQSIAVYLVYCIPSYEVWQKMGCLKLEESPKIFHGTALCSFLEGFSCLFWHNYEFTVNCFWITLSMWMEVRGI